jgi:hypothetical protein
VEESKRPVSPRPRIQSFSMPQGHLARPVGSLQHGFARLLAARGGSQTEPFGMDSARMQGAAKRQILEVFKRAATQPRWSGRALLDRSTAGGAEPSEGSASYRRARIRPNGDAETFATGC